MAEPIVPIKSPLRDACHSIDTDDICLYPRIQSLSPGSRRHRERSVAVQERRGARGLFYCYVSRLQPLPPPKIQIRPDGDCQHQGERQRIPQWPFEFGHDFEVHAVDRGDHRRRHEDDGEHRERLMMSFWARLMKPSGQNPTVESGPLPGNAAVLAEPVGSKRLIYTLG